MKRLMKKMVLLCIAGVLLTGMLAGCGGKKTEAIRVGTKDFTENLIVGEIYALALEDAGYEVERIFDIAGSVVHTSITLSLIHI